MYEFIYVMKAIASCLVMNSHFDGIWPVSALATGGAVGNCLFFSVTGFLIANIKQPFFPWYGKKLMRLYPAIFIITSISIPFRLIFEQGFAWGNKYGLLAELLLSSRYWFLQALIFLYIPYYLVMSTECKNYLPQVGCIVCLIYLVCYFAFKNIRVWTIEDGTRFKWIFYFGIMLIGAKYAKIVKDRKEFHSLARSGIMASIAFGMFYGFKFILDKFPAIMPFQLVEHIILAAFTYEIFAFFLGLEQVFKRCSTSWLWKPVRVISSITLEIFLVMDYLISVFEGMKFPLSLLLSVSSIWISAWVLHIIQQPISKKLSQMIVDRG